MEVSDLVAIGKLGRLEPDGFYCVQFSQPYKSILNQLQECFLIFNSHRVFFVTVVETKTSGSRMYLRFLEDGIAEECKKTAQVIVALAPEDVTEQENEDEATSLVGFSVRYNDEEIGTISDAMLNPMQSVFVIALNDRSELLVPNVNQYVQAIDRKKKIVICQNLELLLEVCKSTS
jgi:ribosomal 30S subunit maturation factor RimM